MNQLKEKCMVCFLQHLDIDIWIFSFPKAKQGKSQQYDFLNVSETLIWKLSTT